MALRLRKLLKVRSRRVSGFVKDRLAMERVRFRADPRTVAVQLCVLRATTHAEKPPSREAVNEALPAFTGSRLYVTCCVKLLMQRLSKAKSWTVVLKCLTLVHIAVQHGGFILQEQLLGFYPRPGGKNPFNFSQFRDRSSFLSWKASSWIQWYAAYLEALIKASSICPARKSSLSSQNDATIQRLLSLQALVQEMSGCTLEENDVSGSHDLIINAFCLVVVDYISTQSEIRQDVEEISKRLGELTVLQIRDLLDVHEALDKGCKRLAKFISVAISKNCLSSEKGFDQLMLTGNELMRVKDALVETYRALMNLVDE